MRIHPVYIVILVIVGIAGFVIYAALSGDAGDVTSPAPPVAPSNTGMLPSVDIDQNLVPKLEVETDTFHMGTVTNSEPTTKELTVKNTGSEKLVVREISTSCACTTGKINPKEIMPGEAATLEVTVYPNRIPGFYTHKRLTLITNAPNAPMQNIDVIARIDPEFEVIPDDALDFGTVQKGERNQREVLLRQLGEEPIELLDVRMIDEQAKGVTFEWERRPESEWQEAGKPEYTITATLEPFALPGEFTQMCYIVTSCKRVPRYRQPIKAMVKSFYELSDKRLFFSTRPGQSKETPLASLEIKADRPIKIIDPEITGDEFSVELVPGSDSNSMKIQLHCASKVTPGRKNEALTFFVKAEGGEPLPNLVPVRGTIMNLQ
ncbi:MAG: DUF1573 domain-containing protein [Candidatus Hydrogenedentota bacterium]